VNSYWSILKQLAHNLEHHLWSHGQVLHLPMQPSLTVWNRLPAKYLISVWFSTQIHSQYLFKFLKCSLININKLILFLSLIKSIPSSWIDIDRTSCSVFS
jgi:hypothetical protein